ncbi:hypothetical protein PInf_003206 [Phytophthora infestans]|nr:hypothetical protein PInf_003206 [Phytophthora infestans]
MSTVTVTAAAPPSSEAKERRYDAFLDAEETRKMTKRGSVLFAVSVPIAKDDSVTVSDAMAVQASISTPCSALLSEATKTQSKKRKRKHKKKTRKTHKCITVTAAAAPSSEAKERRYDAFLDAEETRKMTKRGSVLFAVSVPIAKDDSVTVSDAMAVQASISTPCSALLSEATKTQSKKRKRKHKKKNKKNAQV